MKELELMEERAVKITELATGLSDRIVEFENFITNLKGKVKTEVIGKNITLRVTRKNNSWAILFKENDSKEDFKRLTEAPIAYKIESVNMFPDVLICMVKSQEEIIKEIEKACREFDAFYKKNTGE